MRFGGFALLLVSVVTAAAACSSVPNVTFSDDAAGDGGADVVIEPSEGGPDAVVPPPPPSCVPTDEICGDGIDNDCDGRVDCADPDCTAGYACVDAPPTGWDLVAFSSTLRPSCPTTFAAPVDLKVTAGDGANATCTCSCSGANGAATSCSGATYDLGYGTSCATPVSSLQSNTAGTCVVLPSSISVSTGTPVQLTLPNGPTSCTPTTTKTASSALTDGRQCAAPSLGKGCSGSRVCAPKPPPTMKLCAAKSGAATCTGLYPTTMSRAGTLGTQDNRACNACDCGPTPCTGSLTLYSNSQCKINGNGAGTYSTPSVTLGGACSAITFSAATTTATAYTSTVSGGCAPTGFDPGVTGSIAFENEETVCCK